MNIANVGVKKLLIEFALQKKAKIWAGVANYSCAHHCAKYFKIALGKYFNNDLYLKNLRAIPI